MMIMWFVLIADKLFHIQKVTRLIQTDGNSYLNFGFETGEDGKLKTFYQIGASGEKNYIENPADYRMISFEINNETITYTLSLDKDDITNYTSIK